MKQKIQESPQSDVDFKTMIEEQRQWHELMQGGRVPVVIQPKVYAHKFDVEAIAQSVITSAEGVGKESVTKKKKKPKKAKVDQRQVAMARQALIEEKREKIKRKTQAMYNVLGEDVYMRYRYMTGICITIVGWLLGEMIKLFSECDDCSQRLIELMQEMYDAQMAIAGRITRVSDGYMEEIKCMRRHFLSRDEGNFEKHITMLKNTYLWAFKLSGRAYTNENDNDLMAWIYTAYALCEENHRFSMWIVDSFNSKCGGYEELTRAPMYKMDIYPGYKVLKNLMAYLKLPKLEAANIQMYRDVVQNQMRIAKMNEYYDQEVKLAQMVGKTIRLA